MIQIKFTTSISERYCIIENYPDYIVTESGKIYSCKKKDSNGYIILKELSPKGLNNPSRYLQVCLCKNNTYKDFQIHRLVAKYFCVGYFDGAVVDHIDGDIHNNHYTNLQWVSQKHNIHKSYIQSGMNQVRNYLEYQVVLPDNTVVDTIFAGFPKVKTYLISINANVSYTSLQKYRHSNGYKLIIINNQNKQSNSND